MTQAGQDDLHQRLRRALPAAMKARDRVAVTALRSALGAIDNAEAVDPTAVDHAGAVDPTAVDHAGAVDPAAVDSVGAVDPARVAARPQQPDQPTAGSGRPHQPATGASHPKLAGTVAGLGAAEVERRSLTPEQIEAIVRAEIDDRKRAATGYEQAGQPEHAERLRGEAAVLTSYLDTTRGRDSHD